jgi:C4-dicarboxylate-specific signal transduction histidine kinase
VAEACREKLVNRGVRLVVQAGEEAPIVRGSRDRLRQALEHLLNNAAQAVALVADLRGGEEHAIRLTVSQDDRMVNLIVSDTGPGFREPGRVFDPFYTTGQPGEGVGLGLSLCYGIVREHGGEISAFNLHPHGATVVVELPVWEIATEKSDVVVREMSCAVSD